VGKTEQDRGKGQRALGLRWRGKGGRKLVLRGRGGQSQGRGETRGIPFPTQKKQEGGKRGGGKGKKGCEETLSIKRREDSQERHFDGSCSFCIERGGERGRSLGKEDTLRTLCALFSSDCPEALSYLSYYDVRGNCGVSQKRRTPLGTTDDLASAPARKNGGRMGIT